MSSSVLLCPLCRSGLCGPGHFCSGGATVALPPAGSPTGGLCSAGYACAYGSDSPTPLQSLGAPAGSGDICTNGTACPVAAPVARGCLPGSYQPSSGQASCLTCTAGGFCTGNTTRPTTCPQRFFCPAGSAAPTVCPNSTYGAAAGLASVGQCSVCPTGRYCVYGSIAGVCSAGYVCVGGSGTPSPEPFNGINASVGYPCPIGFW